MELKVPLEVVLNWIGADYSSEYDVYQIAVCGVSLHIQLFEDRGYARVISTYNFSTKLLEELADYMQVVRVYN